MSVTENAINFNEIEKIFYRHYCRLGCKGLKEILEGYDAGLLKNRDKATYRNKGKRRTVIKTVMGEVEYSRTIYETIDESGMKKYVFLLDEAMGISGSGFMSGMLSELIVNAACESTYRNAARTISEATGQTISHTAAWNVVQDLGERLNIREESAADAAAVNKGCGVLETGVLFEEMDGIWLKLQGASRKEHGKSREMKLSIAYDGAEEKGEKRYQLTNKVACAGFHPASEFMKRKEGVIAGTYNTDEIKMRLLNGDGASWIKQGKTDETVHFQLSVYHINEALRTHVKNDDMRKMFTELLYGKKIDELLNGILIMADSAGDDNELEHLYELHAYFSNNKEGLIPCHRRGLDIPPPPEGKVYRRMGAMESNVFTLVGNRMKGRRLCWSIGGANNLARILCLKVTGKLSDSLQNLTSLVLPEKYAEEIITGLSASKSRKSAGKGYDGYRQALAPPTPDYKWLKGIGSLKPFSERSYI